MLPDKRHPDKRHPHKRRPPEPRAQPDRPAQRAASAARNPLPDSADPILVGRIVGAWGVRGWVRVAPYNDPRLSLLLRLPVWFLRAPAGSGSAELRALDVEQARAHGSDEIVAKLAGVDERDAARALEGTEVLLPREQFPALPADEVYWADLIGCTVRDPDGDPLGTIIAVEDHPAHPVMRLSIDVAESAPTNAETPPHAGAPPQAGARRSERLIPFVPELIRSVDLAARVVVADWRRDW